jgi:hypothetical protein
MPAKLFIAQLAKLRHAAFTATPIFSFLLPDQLLYKGKVPLWGPFKALQPYRLIVLLNHKGVPSFISRGAAHQRRAASEGRNDRWNLANNSVVHVSC